MASLKDLLRPGRPAKPAPDWAKPLFAAELAPHLRRKDGEQLHGRSD